MAVREARTAETGEKPGGKLSIGLQNCPLSASKTDPPDVWRGG